MRKALLVNACSSIRSVHFTVIRLAAKLFGILVLFTIAPLTIREAEAQINDSAYDMATVVQFSGIRSDAYITSQQSLINQWPQRLGPGKEYGFLSGNFSGSGAGDQGDDIAAICFNPDPRGNGHVLITHSPGSQSGTLWQRALGDNNQFSYYVLPADFNGDGAFDLATVYYGSAFDAVQDARVKITFGPVGSIQTNSPTAQTQTGDGVDWRLSSARDGAYLAADFIQSQSPVNSLGRDDMAVITRIATNYTVRFFRGPDGAQVGSPVWNFSGGTPVAFRAGDFNADGWPDIVYVYLNEQSQYRARIIFGPSGAPSPDVAVNFPAGANVKTFLVGDFDNDGLFDLAGTYNLNGVNQAIVHFGPNFTRPSVVWQLRSDITASNTHFLSGQFGTLGSSSVSCPNGMFDRCGICNGNGTSCLDCVTTDNSDSLAGLVEDLLLQRHLYSRALRALIGIASTNKVRYRKTIRKARRDLANADSRYGLSLVSQIFQSFPTTSQVCNNQEFCTSSDLTAGIQEINAISAELLQGSEITYAQTRRISTSRSTNKNARKRVERARRTRAEVELNLASLPGSTSVCSM